MIDIRSKSKVKVHWNVSPYDYSKEKLNTIQAKISKKYGISKDRVKVVPEFIIENDGVKSVSNDVIQNIQDPQFQLKLFRDWLDLNKVEDYDFELIKKIDAEINGKIDYQVYDKYHRYSIKWLRWSNFLSYGADNYFDFSDIGHLVLLSSNPSNQGGKTTFSIDLIRFLLFGSVSRYKTQDKFFNKHLQDATVMSVEGCVSVDGTDYVIRRTLSRPSIERRTQKSKTTQKVEYYKIIGDTLEKLEDVDVDNLQGESTSQTNKVIKESIGNEDDFDLIMSVTDSTLDELVKKKDTERGRLLARWIGLLPLEEKDALAREKFNSDVKPFLLSNQYSEGELVQEIEAFNISSENLKKENTKLKKENTNLIKEIERLETTKTTLLSSKRVIDENILKIDIETLKAKMEKQVTEGKNKAKELENTIKEIDEIGNVTFSVENYDKIQEQLSDTKKRLAVASEKYRSTKASIEHLKKSEVCPTCGRKLDGVDNSKKIGELEDELKGIEEEGKREKELMKASEGEIERLRGVREKYEKKNKLEMKKAALELNIERMRGEYKENLVMKRQHDENSEAIDKNNSLDIEIRNTDLFIRDKRNTKDRNLETISRNEETLNNYKKQVNDRVNVIKKIKEEAHLIKNWKIYLDLVGKNGISKMVLRKTLPIINARLGQLLGDVCDFDVEVGMNVKNDVMFYLIKDGIKSDLQGASGFELTAAALALRAVLADISMIPKISSLTLDEVWGRVSVENFDNMKRLIDKIAKSYDNVFIISHHSEIDEWCDSHVVVTKENNVSSITRVR